MKKTTLKRRNWILGGSALFLLYAGMHSGGIVYRLALLGAATGCSALWLRSKQRWIRLAPQALKVAGPAPEVQALPYFAKMPVRYPRPVYIHRKFELQVTRLPVLILTNVPE